MPTALAIITDAYERLNRLSPGEVLSADDAAFGLRRLNLLVDELSAQPSLLFRSILTSAPQSGPITLGVGAWAAINAGDDVISATANNLALSPITMQQYNELYQPNVTGTPTCWAQDGLGTVYLWPVPTGQTVKLMTRSTVAAFAELAADYVLADGWTNALGAALAVRLAPPLIGGLPAELVRAESRALGAVRNYQPAMLNVDTYNRARMAFPPRLF